MVAKFIGILSSCQAHLMPVIPSIYTTKEASNTREECVIRLWHTIIDEMVGDASIFLNYTLDNLKSKLRVKFESFFEDLFEDEETETETDDEENVDRKNEEDEQEIRLRLKKIELTEDELRDVMYASLSEDHYYEIQIISVSF